MLKYCIIYSCLILSSLYINGIIILHVDFQDMVLTCYASEIHSPVMWYVINVVSVFSNVDTQSCD